MDRDGQSGRVELTVSTRTVLRVLAASAAFGGGLYLVWSLRDVLLLAVIAAFLALALNPAVVFLERRLGLGRGAASVIVFVVVVAVLVGFLATILTPLYTEVRAFIDRVPGLVEDLRESRFVRDLDARYDLFQKLQEQAETLPERVPTTASALLGVASTLFSAIVTTVSVLFLTLFLLLELPTLGRSILSLLTPPTAMRSRTLVEEINQNLARYVAGVFTIVVLAGSAAWLVLTVLGVPFALVLALIVGVFDLIPLIGATIGLVICVLVAFTQGVVPGVGMLTFGVIYQQIENNIIQPIVMRRSVAVSPFVVLFSVLAGSALLGVVGALLAIPFAGSVQIALREVLEARRAAVLEQADGIAAAEAEAAAGEGDATG